MTMPRRAPEPIVACACTTRHRPGEKRTVPFSLDLVSLSAMSIEQAIAGDERAFAALVEPHRRELQLHCYRMLGSLQDAEDLVQETLLAAWRGLGGFEQRASLRAWLYRIATNRCLNALLERGRRPAAGEP